MKLLLDFILVLYPVSWASAFDLQVFARIMILSGPQMFQTPKSNWMGNFASVDVENGVTQTTPFKGLSYPGGIFAFPAD